MNGRNNVNGTSANDNLDGTSSADYIAGQEGDDVLNGQDGHDVLTGGAGADTYDGGAGNDRYILGNDGNIDTLYFVSNDEQQDILDVTDVLPDRASSSNLKDFLKVTSTGVYIDSTGRGNFTADSQVARFSAANSNFGNIISVHVAGVGTIQFDRTVNSDDPLMTTSPVTGTDGDDALNGSDASDRITGGAGSDTLSGGAGVDYYLGGAGNDIYVMDDLSSVDVLRFTNNDTEQDVLDISEIVSGVTEENIASFVKISERGVYIDTTGNGRFTSNTQIAAFDKQSELGEVVRITVDDSTTLDFNWAESSATPLSDEIMNERMFTNSTRGFLNSKDGEVFQLQLDTHNLRQAFGGQGDEELDASSVASDRVSLYGRAGNDTLRANDDNAYLDGGDGDDRLFGGDGRNVMYGGEGSDEFIMTLEASTNEDLKYDILADFTSIESHRDILNLEQILPESATESNLRDYLMITDNGVFVDVNGTREFNLENQLARFGASSELDSQVRLKMPGGSELLFNRDENLVIEGDDEDEVLKGGDGSYEIRGGGGDDILDGDALGTTSSADQLYGGTGNDELYVDFADISEGVIDGGEGYDRVRMETEAGQDTTFNMQENSVEFVFGGDSNDTIDASGYQEGQGTWGHHLIDAGERDASGTQRAVLIGDAGEDTLIGGDGRDYLDGGTDDDRIEGGVGRDFMIGGAGDDTFVLSDDGAVDIIWDFTSTEDEQDRFDISALIPEGVTEEEMSNYLLITEDAVYVDSTGGGDFSDSNLVARMGGGSTIDNPVSVTANGTEMAATQNTAPVAGDPITANVAEDNSITLTQEQLLTNASDPENDSLTATNLSTSDESATITENDNGSFTITPGANFNGELELNFDITDDSLSTSSQVNLTVTAVNDGPEASNFNDTIEEDQTRIITPEELLENATDLDGDDITVTSLQVTNNTGDIIENDDGTWTFQPNEHLGGAEAILEYTVSDGITTTTANYTLTIQAVADDTDIQLSAYDTSGTEEGSIEETELLEIDEGGTFQMNISSELVDTDGSETLTIFLDNNPIGSVVSDGTNSFTITEENPSAEITEWSLSSIQVVLPDNYVDWFRPTIRTLTEENDGDINETTSYIRVGVRNVNDAPETEDRTETISEHRIHQFETSDFEFNDIDSGANFVRIEIKSLPDGGELKLNDDLVEVGQRISSDNIDNLTYTSARIDEDTQVTFDFTVSDGALESESKTYTLNITSDVDEAPTVAEATDVEGAITELDDGASGESTSTLTENGSFTITADDYRNTQSVEFAATATDYLGSFSVDVGDDTAGDGSGRIDWNFEIDDGDLDYLAEGQTLIQTYTVTVSDGVGGTVDQDVAITITGTNDAPDITVTDVAGTITELDDGADGERTATLTDDGSFIFDDVDLNDDGHTVDFTATSSGYLGEFSINVEDPSDTSSGRVDWNFEISDGDIDYLADGETLNQTYTVTVSDGQGGTTEQDVVVTITGTNDRPTIQSVNDVSGSVTESADRSASENSVTHSDNGSFTIADVDLSDAQSVSVTPAGSGYRGNFSPTLGNSSNGTQQINWSYSVDDSALDDLNAGQALTQTYTVTVTDSSGDTVTQDVSINLNGTQDVSDLVNHKMAGKTITLQIGGSNTFGAPISASATITLPADVSSGYTREVQFQQGFNLYHATIRIQDVGSGISFSQTTGHQTLWFNPGGYIFGKQSIGVSTGGAGVGINRVNMDGGTLVNGYIGTGGRTWTTSPPVVIDLDGDGIEIIGVDESETYLDVDGDGDQEKTAWVSGDDGFIITDLDGDGTLSSMDELFIAQQTEEHDTDLEALAKLYDSNQDDVLNSEDEKFEDILIFQDKNQNGVADEGEIITLAEAGITEISVVSDKQQKILDDGSIIHGQTTYTKADGSEGIIGDVELAYEDSPQEATSNSPELLISHATDNELVLMFSETLHGSVENAEFTITIDGVSRIVSSAVINNSEVAISFDGPAIEDDQQLTFDYTGNALLGVNDIPVETISEQLAGFSHSTTKSLNTLIGDADENTFHIDHDGATVTGGEGRDVFFFDVSGMAGGPSDLTITDFNQEVGDVLKVDDILINSADSLDQLFSFSTAGADTIMEIRQEAGGDVTKRVTFKDIDLTGGGLPDADVINNLLDNGNLQADL
ncbi:tandem-95 repeat protein [uncultured Endozoicomonas sp.]|uniref:tandem-95 repeat protein n=1 Tax=uncultured Endozoicomonas sp. TaxID=432652 RepID=UPI00260F95D7|nr:tandem-95 repeat protein [uncultured Endozoicomonas sp.]